MAMIFTDRRTFERSLPILLADAAKTFGLTLHVGGSQACTDGKTTHIPALPVDNADAATLALGCVYHEGFHKWKTDMEFWMANAPTLHPLARHAWNTFEDVMIEASGSRVYLGCVSIFYDLVELLATKDVAGKRWFAASDPGTPAGALVGNYLLNRSRSYLLDQDALAPFATVDGQLLDQAKPGVRSQLDAIIARVPAAESTQDTYALALEVLEILEKGNMDQQDQQPQPQSGSGQGQQSQSGQGGSGQQDQDQQKGASKSGSKSQKGKDKDKKGDDQGSGSGQSDSDSSKEKGKDKGGSGGEGSEDDSESGSEKKSGKSKGKGSDKSKDGNGQGEKDSDTKGSGSGKDQDEENDGGKAGSDGDSSDDSGSQDGESGSSNASGQKSKGRDEKGENGNGAGQGFGWAEALEVTEDELPKDLGELLRAALEDEAENTAYPTSRITVASAAPAPIFTSNLTPAMVMAESNALRTRLEGLIQASQLEASYSTRQGKRFDMGRLNRLCVGDIRVFEGRDDVEAVNTAIHLLLDRSISMKDNMGLAAKACLALALSLSTIRGVNVAVSAFPGLDYSTHDVTTIKTHAESTMDYRKFGIAAGGGTPLGEALWWVGTQMHNLRETRKMIVVLTDGEPNNPNTVHDVTNRLTNSGYEIFGIGIKTSAPKTFFRNTKCIWDMKELPNAVFSMLQTALLRVA